MKLKDARPQVLTWVSVKGYLLSSVGHRPPAQGGDVLAQDVVTATAPLRTDFSDPGRLFCTFGCCLSAFRFSAAGSPQCRDPRIPGENPAVLFIFTLLLNIM